MKLKLAVAALAGATLFAMAPASAQYWDPYERPAPRYERPGYGYGGGYYGGGYNRPYSRRDFGRMCVTSRGDCQIRPAPIGAGCRCFIPGFGTKRGNVGY